MTFEGGRRLRAKQFMTFSVTSVKHKKDKKLFLHADLTYSFTKAIKRVFITLSVVCCTIKHSASTERD